MFQGPFCLLENGFFEEPLFITEKMSYQCHVNPGASGNRTQGSSVVSALSKLGNGCLEQCFATEAAKAQGATAEQILAIQDQAQQQAGAMNVTVTDVGSGGGNAFAGNMAMLPGNYWLQALALGMGVLAVNSLIVGLGTLIGKVGIALGAVLVVLIGAALRRPEEKVA